MTSYDHMLLIVDNDDCANSVGKVNALADHYGSRLSVGYCMPAVYGLRNGVINFKNQYREVIKNRLLNLGTQYRVPAEDQWILSHGNNESTDLFNKNSIDLIVLDKHCQPDIPRSQLANNILQMHACDICFING